MKRHAGAPGVSIEQLRYARVLNFGMRFGLYTLLFSFPLYVFDVVPAHIALERLPELWTLSAPAYLRETGIPDGWAWLTMVNHGDMLPILGIAILSGVSVACFLSLLPLLHAQRDWVYVAIAVCEIGVLTLAASGVLTGGH